MDDSCNLWLQNWDAELWREGAKILLFQDNLSGHVVLDTLTKIHVKSFRPNLTAHIQPNNQDIVQCFKVQYWAKFIHHAIDHYEVTITPSQIYNIDQTYYERWMFYPIQTHNPTIPISSLMHHNTNTLDIQASNVPILQAEKNVEHALNNLQPTWVLQHLNQMSLVKLLNLACKAYNIYNATDQDILYKAVMDAKKVYEAQDNSDLCICWYYSNLDVGRGTSGSLGLA